MNARDAIVHVFLSPIQHESRLLKECRSALEARVAARVVVLGLWMDGLAETETNEPGLTIQRVRVRSRGLSRSLPAQALKYIEWMLRVLRRVGTQRPLLVHAHSLAALPVAILAKLWYRCPVVYDAHELESERTGLTGLRKTLSRHTERLLIRYADRNIVVGEGIADWYACSYGIARPDVVRNVPVPERAGAVTAQLRQRCGLGAADFLFVYVGVLGPGRDIERLCRVFAAAAADRHLVFLGYGSLEHLVTQYASEHPNIHFPGAVPPDDIAANLRDADVGICLIEDVSLSYRLSLPNKVFQCIGAGVPVLINDLPEQATFARDLGCGWIAPAQDEALRSLVNSLDREEIALRRQRACSAATTLTWDREVVPYLDYCRQVALSAQRVA